MATLNDFPRPSVAVDVAVCTVVDGRLCMILWRRTGRTAGHKWALPGSFVREREQLADAVARTLGDKCGIVGLAPTQLAVMDDPNRDNRGWVLSVAHLDVVDAAALGGLGGQALELVGGGEGRAVTHGGLGPYLSVLGCWSRVLGVVRDGARQTMLTSGRICEPSKRRTSKPPTSTMGASPRTRSRMTSPSAGPRRKPWPEKPVQ